MFPRIDIDLNAIRINEAKKFIETFDRDIFFDDLFKIRCKNVFAKMQKL